MISKKNPGFLFIFYQPVFHSSETLKQQIKKNFERLI